MRVIHELHTAINRTFAAHGIKIPGPKTEDTKPKSDMPPKPKLPLVGAKKADQSRLEKEPEAA